MRRAYAAALACLALPAGADPLRPAPDYFVQAMVSITIAESIAAVCPTLGVDSARAAETATEVLGELTAEGFDPQNLAAGMADPGPAVRAVQAAFRARHGLTGEGDNEQAVCAAGLREIAGETPVGAFLIEVTGDGAVDPTQDTGGR